MTNTSIIPIRLAAALLLKRGEISLRDIRSLPLVDNDKDYALAIANQLSQHYDIEFIEQDLNQNSSQMEDVLLYLSPMLNKPKRQNAPENLAKSIIDKFSPLGGVELDLPLR